MTERPMVKIRPTPTELEMAIRRAQPIPIEVSQDTIDLLVTLKARGMTFADIAAQAPECLNAMGAFVVFRHAILSLTASPRAPFDGKPNAPAWQPNTSALAAKLRPLERVK